MLVLGVVELFYILASHQLVVHPESSEAEGDPWAHRRIQGMVALSLIADVSLRAVLALRAAAGLRAGGSTLAGDLPAVRLLLRRGGSSGRGFVLLVFTMFIKRCVWQMYFMVVCWKGEYIIVVHKKRYHVIRGGIVDKKIVKSSIKKGKI